MRLCVCVRERGCASRLHRQPAARLRGREWERARRQGLGSLPPAPLLSSLPFSSTLSFCPGQTCPPPSPPCNTAIHSCNSDNKLLRPLHPSQLRIVKSVAFLICLVFVFAMASPLLMPVLAMALPLLMCFVLAMASPLLMSEGLTSMPSPHASRPRLFSCLKASFL